MGRFTGILGIIIIIGLAYLWSNNRKRINYRLVITGLLLQVVLAVFILKVPLGQEIFYWLGMAYGEIPARDTASTRTVSDAIGEGPVVVVVTNLYAGENVLAVEVHQTNPGSSDVVFGMAADVIEVRREMYTPGYANSVRPTSAPTLRPVAFGTAGQTILEWSAVSGRTYRLEFKEDLEEPAWRTVGQLTASASTVSLVDSGATKSSQRFYRVVLLP